LRGFHDHLDQATETASDSINVKIKRFMILGAARTGSNFLLSLLSSHPAIKTYGELFNLDALPRDNLTEALEDPVAYLKRRVYKPHGSSVSAVGFKMFYDHLTKDYFDKPVRAGDTSQELQDRFDRFSAFVESNYDWDSLTMRFRGAWDFLIEDVSLVVIHLKRRNALDTLISLKRAFATDKWWSLKSESGARFTVHLDPEECSRYFQRISDFQAAADTAFASHARIDVIYEDLVERQQDALKGIFTLLDVPCLPLTTRMIKQNPAPARETVANYEQLKNHFRPTQWGELFE
jgi:LPS sulfotransferase NodH